MSSLFCSEDCGKKFSFSRTGSSDGLSLTSMRITPPLNAKACPVVDRRFRKSLPCAASKKAVMRASFPVVGKGGNVVHGL